LFDYRLMVLERCIGEFDKEEYINKCKDYISSSFTRSRIFTLKRLIVLLMLLQTSYQREINRFGKKLLKGDYNIRQATAGALSQARAKLNPYAFQRLQEIAVTTFYEEANYIKWNDLRVIAVDGSVLNLPYSQSIIEEFGSEDYINKSIGKKSMARCSILYDVFNHVTIDAQLSSYRTSEKVLLEKHLPLLGEGDLLLGDRGYAYSSIMYWLSKRKVDFCFRFHDHKMNVVVDFLATDEQEKEIDLTLDAKVIKSMNLSKDTAPIKVRLIKVKLDNGKIEVLGTSLLDTEKYKRRVFKNLYHKRWGVEEAFKMLKCRLDLENFSGRTARSIYQDFYAKIFMMAMCATFTHPIEEKVRKEYAAAKTGNKYEQQINKSDALAETRSNLISIFIFNRKQEVIDIIDKIILASRKIIRPGRKEKRIKTPKKRKALNYKQL